MNFKNMEYFVSVVTEGGITKAAEKLNITQQALSNSISRLEEELDCELFDRKQNLVLTYSGKQFLESCNKILDIQRQTTAAIDDINNNARGELRIGISFTRGQAILPLLLPKFSAKYPNVELKVVEGSSQLLEDYLQKGLIDVLIGFAPFMLESAQYEPLMLERLYLVVSNKLLEDSFPGRSDEVFLEYEETKDLKLFENMPFILLNKGDRIRAITDSNFKKFGIRPNIKLETQNTQTAFALACEGMGLTICPELYLNNPYVVSGLGNTRLRHKVRFCRFLENDKIDTIAIGYNKDRYISSFARDFIDMSREIFRNQAQQPQE